MVGLEAVATAVVGAGDLRAFSGRRRDPLAIARGVVATGKPGRHLAGRRARGVADGSLAEVGWSDPARRIGFSRGEASSDRLRRRGLPPIALVSIVNRSAAITWDIGRSSYEVFDAAAPSGACDEEPHGRRASSARTCVGL
jgi:hypothetical protein